MKIELNVSAASKVMLMANCPREFQGTCGIAYRSS